MTSEAPLDEAVRAQARAEPVPPNVFFACQGDRLVALCVDGPDRVRLQRERNGAWQPARVTKVSRRLRPWRVNLDVVGGDGAPQRLKLFVLGGGEAGRLDVGHDDGEWRGHGGPNLSTGGGGSDPITSLIEFILLIAFLFYLLLVLVTLPFRFAWCLRRRRAGLQLRRYLRQ